VKFSARGALGLLAALLALLAIPSLAAADPALPPGFQDEVVFGGLNKPTAVRFAPNGMVFVAEKNGKIEVYENLEDETPELFKDLTVETYDHGDRGLLGLAVDPEFPAQPYVYALFTYDHVLGEEAPPPKWGTGEGDSCPLVPANEADDCVVSGRLVRYTANVTTDGEGHLHAVASGEKALIPEDWCQQFSSHSIGDLRFGPEGALYAGGGDGASFTSADFGQLGNPPNPCGDPPKAGGSLRSQDLITPETKGDPTNLSGTIIRIDPETGEGWPTNPLAGSSSANERRIVALGFRNPFRFTLDPKTGEMYVGNVGSSEFEEIDRFDPTSGKLFNSGWPCYEGADKQFQFKTLELPICEQLYEEPERVSKPLFYYSHRQAIAPGDECSYAAGSAIAGPVIYDGEEFPANYEGALFFSDAVRGCFYVMPTGTDGRPDPSKVETFMTGGSLYPGVDIEEGPDGSLYYASLFGEGFSKGAIHRITYAPGAPSAKLSADSQFSKEVEHEFHLDASESSDPTNEALTFEWDLDGNGSFETKGGETQTVKYTEAKNVVVAVRVEDGEGLTNTAKLTLYPGDTPPVPTIKEPSPSYLWGVGDQIHLSGSAINSEGKAVEPLFMQWSTRILHCPNGPENCHAHPLQDFPGVLSANLIAPEHDYPSYIEITLSASDKRGLSASQTIKLSPRVFTVHFASNPPGVPITAGLVAKTTPFEVPSVEGAQLVIAAPESTQLNGKTYTFQSWSDGGAPIHTIVAKGQPLYTATYTTPGEGGPGPGPGPGPPKPPVTQLRKHPPKSTHSTTAKFTFGADTAGASFKCKLDGKPKTTCRSPKTYKRLKPGKHTFKVWASAGVLTDQTPAKFSWKILPPRH
jgi:glucose/arabinose dehydrogenase